jgi:hypothetical protein
VPVDARTLGAGAPRAAGLSALLATVAAVGLLAGCATDRWIYTKPGVTPAALDHDLGACRREAHRPYTFAITRARRVDRQALNLCMERKGYTARPGE